MEISKGLDSFHKPFVHYINLARKGKSLDKLIDLTSIFKEKLGW